MAAERSYIQLKLKDLITKSGVKLIEIFFQHKDGIDLHYVHLGEAALYFDRKLYDQDDIKAIFLELGFSILLDAEDEIVEKIRIAAVELIHYANNVNSLIRIHRI